MTREPTGSGWVKTPLRMRPEYRHDGQGVTVRVGEFRLYVSRKGPLSDEDIDFVVAAFNAGRPEFRSENDSTCVLDCGGRG